MKTIEVELKIHLPIGYYCQDCVYLGNQFCQLFGMTLEVNNGKEKKCKQCFNVTGGNAVND